MAISDTRTLKPEIKAFDLKKITNFIKIIFDAEEIKEIADMMKVRFVPNQNGKLPPVSKRLNYLSKEVFNRANWIARQKEKTTELYVWNNVYCMQVFKDDLYGVLINIFNLNNWYGYNDNHSSQFFNSLKAMALRRTKHKGILLNDGAERYIPFWNGYIDLVSKEFVDCDPESHIVHCIPASVNIEKILNPKLIKCPGFKSFLTRILPDKEQRIRILTYCAYCFTSSVRRHIAHIWTGGGRNGKSTLTEIIYGLIGFDNCSFVRMETIKSRDRFVFSQMEGKLLNIGSEMSNEDLKSTVIAKIKAMISSPILQDEKKGQDGHKFTNVTKHIYDLNDLPLLKLNMDFSLFDRVWIEEFQQYVGDESERIEGLSEYLLKYEGEDILAYILSFIPYIGKYVRSNSDITQMKWENNVINAYLFAKKFFKKPKTAYQEKLLKPIFEEYKKWCKFYGKKPYLYDQFKYIISSMAGYDITTRNNDIDSINVDYNFSDPLVHPQSITVLIKKSKAALKRHIKRYKLKDLEEKEDNKKGIELFEF